MTADSCGNADSRGSCRSCGNDDSDVIITEIANVLQSCVDIDSISSWSDKKPIETFVFICRTKKLRGGKTAD